ncbi:MAG TPA: hypothetical protein DDX51_04330 [Clostridiales bacterium]|nr:hypothetical protein [Clostridiales bacterium]
MTGYRQLRNQLTVFFYAAPSSSLFQAHFHQINFYGVFSLVKSSNSQIHLKICTNLIDVD